MIYDKLIAAFDNAEEGARWRSFARAVIAEAGAATELTDQVNAYVDRAARAWRDQPSEDLLTALRVEIWGYLKAKNGDSTTIADADDRALRAVITALVSDGTRGAAVDAADWVEMVLMRGNG